MLNKSSHGNEATEMKKSTSFGARSLFGQVSNHKNDDDQSVRSSKSAATLGATGMLLGSRVGSKPGASLRISLVNDLGLLSRSSHKRNDGLGRSSHSRTSLGGKLMNALVPVNKVAPIPLGDEDEEDAITPSLIPKGDSMEAYQTDTISTDMRNKRSANPTIVLPSGEKWPVFVLWAVFVEEFRMVLLPTAILAKCRRSESLQVIVLLTSFPRNRQYKKARNRLPVVI
jgi:hypothetical protein